MLKCDTPQSVLILKQQMMVGHGQARTIIKANNYYEYFVYLPQLTRPHVRHIHKPLVVLQTVEHKYTKTSII